MPDASPIFPITRSPALRLAVFLDRDGTLNAPVVREGKPYPPSSVTEFQLLPGVAEGCRALHAAGYVLVVATNQPDVGRGTQTQAAVEAMKDGNTNSMVGIINGAIHHTPLPMTFERKKILPDYLVSLSDILA